MEWQEKPSVISKFPAGIDYVLGIDETGTANHKGVQRKLRKGQQIDFNDKHFTLSGVLMNRQEHRKLLRNTLELKEEYWPEGKHNYKGLSKMVCFHSREIRKREAPFNLHPEVYHYFIKDLSFMISDQTATIYSTTIDKEELCKKYTTPFHPYQLAAEFLLERFSFQLNNENKNGIIMLESRGPKEDKFVLGHLTRILREGNLFKGSEDFSRVKGIYFNRKWSVDYRTYPILEYADLISYPIHKFVRSEFETRDISFEAIEHKISHYPFYIGKGLKIFPTNRKTATALLGGRPGNPRSV